MVTNDKALPQENLYGHAKKLRFMLAHVAQVMAEHDPPVSLLDFGCGNGSAVSQYLVNERVEYYGVDFHEPSLAYAREKYGARNAHFLSEVPSSVEFDIIVYSDVLEHLDNPIEIVRAHREQLKPGGVVVGAVPNGYGAFENEKRLARWFRLGLVSDWCERRLLGPAIMLRKKIWPKPMDSVATPEVPYNSASGHVQFFTRRQLCSVLEAAGLRLETFRNGCLMGGLLSGTWLLRGQRVYEWNARLADYVPYWAASTWYFAARRDDALLADAEGRTTRDSLALEAKEA